MTELTTVTVRYGRHHNLDRTVELTAEPTVCPYLVITPGIASDEDGRVYFRGRVTLTHTGTGRALAFERHSHRLHELAKKLIDELPGFDWNFTDTNHLYTETAKRDAAYEVIRDWEMAGGYTGPAGLMGDDEEKKAARDREPATTLLAEQLDEWVHHNQAYAKDLDWDNPDHMRIRMAEAASSNHLYCLVYLLAVLRSIDPKVADVAARDLVAMVDAVDPLYERIEQWREEFAKGEPLTLPGIPTHDPLADFTN